MNDFKKYYNFEGVSTRSEYWAVNILSYVVLLVTGLVSALIMMAGIFGVISGVLLMLGTAFCLAWLVFAVTVRRCRDIGISPWFALSLLIPYLAIVPFIVFGCLKSEVKNDTSCC